MKVISLNSSDTFGGAARAAYHLQGVLRHHGVDARLLVQRKLSGDPHVIGPASPWQRGMGLARNHLDRLPFRILGNSSSSLFSVSCVPGNAVSTLNKLCPEIVHLHWICEGLVSIESLSNIKAPLIWTLHDSWPFTGGCHLPNDCSNFQKNCGCCPQLGSTRGLDLSRIGWARKRRMLNRTKPLIISPSRWLARCAATSTLMKDLRIEVVPNGVDTNCFKPFDMVTARKLLGIKENKKILLFSAINGLQHEHKGFHLLKSALAECSLVDGFKETVELYVAGSYEPENFSELTIQTHFLGQLNDDVTLALLYNAADLYLAPALLENFSTTVLEALACGTPSVAFNAGGMADLVDHGINGYLAQAYDVEDFARGIIWSLNDLEQLSVLSANGRRKAEEQFTLDLMAKRHIKLYEDVLG